MEGPPRYWGASGTRRGRSRSSASCRCPALPPAAARAGFARPLEEAALYSADWRAYFASSALGPSLDAWADWTLEGSAVPGLRRDPRSGSRGLVDRLARRRTARARRLFSTRRSRRSRAGPRSGRTPGLYAALYEACRSLAWLRAPARFGILVRCALRCCRAGAGQLLAARAAGRRSSRALVGRGRRRGARHAAAFPRSARRSRRPTACSPRCRPVR